MFWIFGMVFEWSKMSEDDRPLLLMHLLTVDRIRLC